MMCCDWQRRAALRFNAGFDLFGLGTYSQPIATPRQVHILAVNDVARPGR